jgi:nicotinate phosphoribosyltransferase
MAPFLDFLTEENMSMFTDLYELTMCASYFDNQKFETATFDLFIRRNSQNRPYFLFAGLAQVLEFLQTVKFTEQHLAYLGEQGLKDGFLEYLHKFKFTGEVWAAQEGAVVFADEPLIRVTAPIIEAQLVETFLLNTINLQTTIATKASRVVHATQGRPVIEFGLRREHGIDAGMKVARASYIAGCDGTSNVLAGLAYGIPVFGTMAHSFIMSFPTEIDGFRAFAKTFPDSSTLLIDTYDDIRGAKRAVIIGKELEKMGHRLGGVRIDSGDLQENSQKVRTLLDQNGLRYVQIFASGDLDEYKIEQLLSSGAKIDAFGVGTKMGTSSDKPYVDVIYKLCEIQNTAGEFVPIMKLSKNKVTLPGRKQVYRSQDTKGCYKADMIALADENHTGTPLLVHEMQNGKILRSQPTLDQIRKHAEENIAKLPQKYQKLTDAPIYPVRLSEDLKNLLREVKKKLSKTQI